MTVVCRLCGVCTLRFAFAEYTDTFRMPSQTCVIVTTLEGVGMAGLCVPTFQMGQLWHRLVKRISQSQCSHGQNRV